MFDDKGYVYMEIQRGMYRLKRAGKIAKERLIPHGYKPCQDTPGLWKHVNKPISFTLIFNDFGVKYTCKQDAEEILRILQQHYEELNMDWTGTLYSGIVINWEYIQGKV